MSYSLGVDLGTTFVAAAVAQGPRVEMFTLGDRTVVTPAVVYARDDGAIITGEAANRRAVSNPERVGREFKRRLGDPTPVMLDGTPHAVPALLAALLAEAVARVTATEGAPPDNVVLTHPANWGPYRHELFEEVPHLAGLTQARMVTEPEAAAAHYAAARHLRDGDTVAVYDLGGGTFDAAVLRKRAVGIDILGTPEGIERLGGVDFDDAILAHINYVSGGALSELDLSNPQTAVALARLRQDVVLAKEALSIDTEATIPVFLPNRHFDVHLTRPEFEDMIRAQVESTIGALTRTLRSAHVQPHDLNAVLLVGGSSRIPLVAQMITQALDRPTLIDTHPKYAVALGAATLAAELATHGTTSSNEAGSAARTRQPEVQVTKPRAREPAEPRTPEHGVPALGAPAVAEAGVTAARGGGAVVGGGSAVVGPPGDLTTPVSGVGTPVRPDPPTTDRQPADTAYGGYLPAQGNGSPPAPGPTAGPRTPGPGDTPARTAPVPPGPPVAPPGDDAAFPPRGRRRGPVLAAAAAVLVLLVGSIVYVLVGGPSPTTPDAAGRPSIVVLPPPATRPPDTPPSVAPSVPIPSIAGEVSVGETPGFVAIAPNGTFAYIANRAAGVVTVVDTAINQVVATIPIPDGPPQYLAFAPDGNRLYVSVFNDPDRSINRVAVLDTATNTVLTTIPVGTRPYALAVKPDGSELYVPNHDSGTVSVIDTAIDSLVTDIRVKPNPHWTEFSTDGTKVYAANHESNLVSVIDTATRTVVAEIDVQISPHSVAVHPTQPLVANVNYDSNSVTVIDTNTEQVIATVPVGTHPQDLTWAPDGRRLYVTNVDSDNMVVIAIDGYRVTATIPTGNAPTSIAVLPDGTQAYITNLNSGTLTVLDLAA